MGEAVFSEILCAEGGENALNAIPGQIADLLEEDPFFDSKKLCERFQLSLEQLIDCYALLRNDDNLQRRWRFSRHASFFNVAGQILARPERLLKIIRGEAVFPLFVEFHSGGGCPLDCSFCYNTKRDDFKNPLKRKEMIDFGEFRALVDEISAAGAIVFNIAGGGEPLNDPVVLAGLSHAVDRGLQISLNTMGVNLQDPEIADQMLALNQLRVSLNAASSGTYELLGGKKRGRIFQYVCDGLRSLLVLRKNRASKLNVVTSFIIVPENFHEIEKMVELSAGIGVDCVYLRPDYAAKSRPFFKDELHNLERSIIRIKKRALQGEYNGTQVSVGDVFQLEEVGRQERRFISSIGKTRCWCQCFKVGIDAWGNVHRCALVTQPGVGRYRYVIGNLRKDGSLTQITAASANNLQQAAVCLQDGVVCNVFEGYFNLLLTKLAEDYAFGVSPQQQPFKANPESPYRQDPIRVLSNRHPAAYILQDQKGFETAAAWLRTYPGAGLTNGGQEVEQLLKCIKNRPEVLNQQPNGLDKEFSLLRRMRQAYEDCYFNGCRDIPATAREKAALFRPYIEGPRVLDIGCGWNILGQALRELKGNSLEILGLDIQEQNSPLSNGGASFRLMRNPAIIPLPTAYANTAILSFVLHHLQVNCVEYLREVRRVLAPSAKLLILEDSFSENEDAPQQDYLALLFHDLSSDKKRMSFLAFADAFVHRFINQSRMHISIGRYYSMEDWHSLFSLAGFEVIKKEYLGFAALGSRNPVSRAFFVLQAADSN